MKLLAVLALLLLATPAAAQQQVFCPTRPPGDNTNACASTAFVQQNSTPISGLTPNQPVIGSPSGGVAQGTRSGNTTTFPTINGMLVSGHCVSVDANGNLIDAGSTCGSGSGGGGTVSPGTVGQPASYTGTTTVAGTTAVALSVNTKAALATLTGGIVTTVHMQGYYNPSDGGEGNFNWASTCPTTPDAGVYISPTIPVGGGCWVREVYYGLPNIRWWGAHCDYNFSTGTGTDDSGLIQTAINWIGAQTTSTPVIAGGTLYWPRGCVEGISSPVYLSFSSVTISGMGGTGSFNDGSAPYPCSAVLAANSTYTSTDALLNIGPLASQFGPGFYNLSGANVQNMCFFGDSIAQTGLRVASEWGADIGNLQFVNFTFRPLLITVAQFYNGGNALTGNDNIQNVHFHDIHILGTGTGGANPGGIVLEAWGNITNPSLNQFSNIKIDGASQPCIRIAGADSDSWFHVNCFLASGSAVNAVIITGNDNGPGSYIGNDEVFYSLNTNGSQIVIGTGSNENLFVGLMATNGTPVPTCQSGTSHGTWIRTGATAWGSC